MFMRYAVFFNVPIRQMDISIMLRTQKTGIDL